jgi:hypothetical protein
MFHQFYTSEVILTNHTNEVVDRAETHSCLDS